MVEFQHTCDLCGGVWTRDDLQSNGVVRLNHVRDTTDREGTGGGVWRVVGYGTGRGTIFAHTRCLGTIGTHLADDDLPRL